MPGSSRTLKACGGLAPYAWSVTGPATLSATAGVSTTVTCNQGTTDSSPVILTVVDAAGVRVSSVLGGSCACAGCVYANENSPTQCPVNFVRKAYDPTKVTSSGTAFGYDWAANCGLYFLSVSPLGEGSTSVNCIGSGGAAAFYSKVNPGVSESEPPTNHDIYISTYDMSVPVFDNIVGTPSFGLAINVPQGVTCDNFTGLALFWDGDSGDVVLGQYTNGNLNNGARPTIIATVGNYSDVSDMYDITLSNGRESGGDPVIDLFIYGNVLEIEHLAAWPAIDLADNPIGCGFFWLKSSAASSFRFNYDGFWGYATFSFPAA